MNDEFNIFLNNKKISKEKIDTALIVNENELKINLECPICYDICYNNLMCSECHVVFCYDCFFPLNKCPCCSIKEVKKVGTELFPISNIFQSMVVKCKNSKCQKIGNLLEMDKHKIKCHYENQKCPDECGKNIEFINIPKHLYNDCDLNKLQCISCDLTFSLERYKIHSEFCKSIKTLCENCIGYHDNGEECFMNLEICKKCKFPDLSSAYRNNTHVCKIMCEIDSIYLLNYLDKLKTSMHNKLLTNYSEKENKFTNNLERLENIRKKILLFYDEIDSKFKEEKKNLNQNVENCIIKCKNKILEIIEYLTINKKNMEMKIKNYGLEIESFEKDNKNTKTMTSLMYKSDILDFESKIFVNESFLYFSENPNFNEIRIKNEQMNMDFSNVDFDKGKYENIEIEFKRKNMLILKDQTYSFMNDNNKETRILNSQKILCECKVSKLEKQKKCKSCQLIYCTVCKSNSNISQQEICTCNNITDICADCSVNKCKSCDSYVCGSCYYKCFSEACDNIFCERCICLNKMQISAKHKSCNFTPCKDCSNPIYCIFKSIKCKCGKRVCTFCYISNHDEHSNFDFKNKKYLNN